MPGLQEATYVGERCLVTESLEISLRSLTCPIDRRRLGTVHTIYDKTSD